MNGRAPPTFRLHLSLFLLSGALIAYQLEQMQLLALLQWHHFAYLIISVALLGFGAAGTFLALCRDVLSRHLPLLLPLLIFGCAVMMALTLPLLQGTISGFDIGLLIIEPGQAGAVLLGQAAYLLLFFLGALPLGLVFIRHSSRIGSLYCANLLGSGAGAMGIIALMHFLLPQRLPGLTALLCWFAGLLIIPPRRLWPLLGAAISLPLIGAAVLYPPSPQPSQYKDISRVLDLPGSRVERNRPDPQGLAQTVTAPALRHAPGLSLTYRGEVPEINAAIFLNGDWFGAVLDNGGPLLDASASALPYAIIAKPARVLVLEAGAGTDVIQALRNGAAEVTAIEQRRRALELALDKGALRTNARPTNGAMRFAHLAPRTWLALDREHYDLITLPTVGAFGGAAGLFAMQEQYLLTREAFAEIWKHLRPDGVLRVSSWLDSPPRNSLRLATTLIETLEAAGVDPAAHLAAVRGWDMVTFVVKRSPLTRAETRQIRAFSEELQFDPVLLPGLGPEERPRYHFSADADLTTLLPQLLSEEQRRQLYQQYEFDLRPATDNRPFFSQFLRWSGVPRLLRLLGERTLPFLELGYVLVLLSFAQMVLAAALLILAPLLRLRLSGEKVKRRWLIPFFSGLGLGYMFFEMVMIHQLVLYFGHPIIAAAAVIGGLLLFSGLGSLATARMTPRPTSHAQAALAIAILLLLYQFILQPLLQQSIGLPTHWKALVFLALIAPPAFVMGMPFPLGLARLAGLNRTQAAWAWGINGSVSVASTGLAAIIAVELGFSAVMLFAAAAYGLAAASGYGGREST
ncbi:MAG: spermidine synthase-like protein [Thermodesulfobacteriota bacterium]